MIVIELLKYWFSFFSSVNPCDSSPCKNGASCQSGNGKFSCECVEGFEGDTCEEKGTIKYRFSFKFIITDKCI